MAKTSNLREFQEAILNKLKDVTSQVGAVSGSRLGVVVGDKKLLVRLEQVKEALPMPYVQSVPLTAPWFSGVANIRGNLYNITDLAQFLGMKPTSKSPMVRILLLSSEVTTQVALTVGALIGLRNIDVMQLLPKDKAKIKAKENDAASEALFFAEKSYQDADGEVWLEVDFDVLVKDSVFIQPTLS